ncbi:MAG: zinc-binding alcohol dehydrogenase, partial [Anaerolineales bacterium]|nr:zinc-binding alcohol dehydrogenase [Anaerolineales bacterium]
MRTLLSAVSPGTEMLIYRGQAPPRFAVDDTIPSLAGTFQYPLQYGYSVVGRVVSLGSSVDPSWEGRLVFSFNPHQSAFNARPADLLKLPEQVSIEQAVFLPNLETAVGFMMDGQPGIGERVAVFGQGIVGLLTAHLLAQYPLDKLITIEPNKSRRSFSRQINKNLVCLDPDHPQFRDELETRLRGGADLTFEISGAPQALDAAIEAT